MVAAENTPVRQKQSFKIFRYAVAASLTVGILVWLNYGWIESSARQVGNFALHTSGDALDRQSRKLSGPRATDCGRVGDRENRTVANECALKAFREGKPFRVRYDLRGFDSAISEGLVYTPEGKLYTLFFDGDPSGRGGTSWSRQRLGQVTCPLPFQINIDRDGHLNCK